MESKENRGTVFHIYLPAIKDARVESVDSSEKTGSSSGTGRILLVEDDERVRDIASEILKRQGYSIVTAKTAEDALELLKANREPFKLLLTDVILPGIHGRELY